MPEDTSREASFNEVVKVKCKNKFLKSPKLKINKNTLPLKTTLFLYFGGMAAILPYLTIHMQAIGISITEVAIIYAVLPFTSFLGPPVLGFLADKFGDYKWVLILSTIGNGLFHTMLLVVPNYQPSTQIDSHIIAKWNLTNEDVQIVPLDQNHCQFFNPTLITNRTLSLVNCKNFTELQVTNTDLADFPQNKTQATKKEFIKTSLNYGDYEIWNKRTSTANCSIQLNYNDDSDWIGTNENAESEFLFCKSTIVIQTPEVGNGPITFWTYFILRIIATMFMSSCFSLLDATALAVVKRCGKAEYGKERIWSILGTAVTSPIAGVLVDKISKGKGYIDYSAAFYVSDVLLLCSTITFFFLKLEVDSPEKGLLGNAVKLFKYPEVTVFLVMIFILGNMWGFVESYLFIFLKELHAPNYLLGLTLTMGAFVGLPFLWGSEKIVTKFGRLNVIIAAFFTYFVRFFGYSYIENPFWCFPFEAMEAFTYHLMWTAAATYCSLLAPKGMLASLMGIMSSFHYSLGKGSGSFFGGIAYGGAGARAAFRYFGGAAIIFGFIFLVLDCVWIRKIVEQRRQAACKEGELESPKLSYTKRESIIDVNPLANTTSILSLDEGDSKGDETFGKMLDDVKD